MKNKLILVVVSSFSLLLLTACPSKHNNESKKVVGPQGRVTALNNQNSFCDVGGGTIRCASIDPATGASCSSNQKNYTDTDIVSFCQKMYEIQNESNNGVSRCNVADVTRRIISEHCNGVAVPFQGGPNGPNNPFNPNNPNNPISQDPNIKDIKCEFEARRFSNGSFFSRQVNIPKTIVSIRLDGRYESTFDFNRQFLGIDVGRLGKISMTFSPAGGVDSRGADLITIRNRGLNGNMLLSQTGFAGDDVKLQARGPGMFMSVSCKGVSRFAEPQMASERRYLDCRGVSKTLGRPKETIELTFPISEISNGQEFKISNSVYAKLNNSTTAIMFASSVDPDFVPEVLSSASLKSDARIRAADEVANIDVSCRIQ